MEAFGKVADELYALSPREFTAARDVAVARARKAGDRPLAARIKALRRPTLAALAVNRLVRRHREEVAQLLELGRSLREAQERRAGARLRELSGQRHRLVAALTEQARRAAADAGERLGEAQLREVEQSLRAALTDGRAAEVLAEGRLVGVLEETGMLPPVADGVAARSGAGGEAKRAKESAAAAKRPEPAPAGVT